MQYRRFGKHDFKVSALGFGAMRLPTENGTIDEPAATEMIRCAIDRGVNFVDTAYPYHNGAGEAFVGRALSGGYREKVMLSTKMPSWLIRNASDFDRYLDEQLERLNAEYLDFYQLHTLNRNNWPKLRDLGVLSWAEKAMADGRFRYLGFSFHDDTATFKSILDGYDWSMCILQYNFMDADNQAGTEGVRYAEAKGVPVVVMEPLLGGKLTTPPKSVQDIWDSADRPRSAAAWALDWVWNQSGVSTVLSGMSSLEQVKENVALADGSRIGKLLPDELKLYDRVREQYRKIVAVPCTGCGYCVPCPQGVDIPGNFNVYNDGLAFGKPDSSRGQYGWWKQAYETDKIMDRDIRAERCTACGSCETKCPQGIPISRWMTKIHEVLGEGKPYVTSLQESR